MGPLVSLAIATVPCVLWLLFSPIHTDGLAKMSALAALSLLSFNTILSARLRPLERLFFGLDRVYRAHRMLGGIIVMLLLAHSALLTLKYLRLSIISAYMFVLPSTDWTLLLGKLGLYTLVALVVLTLYFRIRYQWFVLAMRILGAVVFVGGYHALFVSGSDLRQNTPLLLYMSVLGIMASGLYVYRSLFHRSITALHEYRVQSVTNLGAITELWLKPDNRPLNRYAGQFAFINFPNAQVDNEQHPFTISAGSNDDHLRFCIKNLGDFTSSIKHIEVGDTAIVEGPYGYFSFTKIPSRNQVWIAGGIGITPFLSMAHSLPSGYTITLYYCIHNPREAVFLKELQSISHKYSGFSVVPWYSDLSGHLTAQDVVSSKTQDYLLCGPSSMMTALKTGLSHCGVPRNRVHVEEFVL